MRPLRIGVVGQSLDAVLLTQSLEQLSGVEVLAVEFPEDPQDITRVLRAGRLGGLVVATPLLKRIYLIRKALDEGLPVLAETPMASDLDSLASLLEERAHRPGPPLLPISPWRFSPDLQLARGILGGGALGDPVTFQVTPAAPAALSSLAAVRAEPPISAAGIIMQQGWGPLDLVRYLFGDVLTVQALRLRGGTNNPMLEGVDIAIQCAGGWDGKIHFASGPPGAAKAPCVVLTGTQGSVEIGTYSSTFVPSDGEAARIGPGCFGIENYERLANAFADVVSSQADPWVRDADLSRTLELLQAAHMSLGAGLAVEAPRRRRRIVAA